MRSRHYNRKDDWYKDRSILREGDSAYVQAKSSQAYVKDYGQKNRVSVEWDMTKDSIDDRICILRVNDTASVIDVEELQRALRFV